eukprot:PhF_6_TR25159/c0_g1_i1/m.34673/K05692/ACTB_G1; actin beta/gamma 1
MSWEDSPAIVLDNGSGMMKAGYAGDEAPKVVFPAAVAHSRTGGPNLHGDNAISAGRGYVVKYPIEHGIIVDWDDMEAVWRHTFQSELQVDPRQHAVLLTEAPLNPKANREKMLEVMFNTFEVPALHIQIQAILTLYASGRSDGVVVDSGDGVSHIVPVFEGHCNPSAVRRLDIAGRDLTEWMMELLSDETERPFTTTRDREIAKVIKENHCRVSIDFEHDMSRLDADPKCFDKVVELPDGSKLTIGKSQFCCPEMLFQPAVAGNEADGVHKATFDAIMRSDIDTRRVMYSNVVLSGGTTMFAGFDTRLRKEIVALAPKAVGNEVKVVAAPDRKYSVWTGAAILGNLSTFFAEWITRAEYDENGPSIVHQKCNALNH